MDWLLSKTFIFKERIDASKIKKGYILLSNIKPLFISALNK